MAKLEIPAKIRVEDFPEDSRDTMEVLAGLYNSFVDQVYQVLFKGVDYENLKRQLVTIDLALDSNKKLKNPPTIKYTLNQRILGLNVLSATNLQNTNVFVESAPFIEWTIQANQIVIRNITGLPANSQYRLLVELIA